MFVFCRHKCIVEVMAPGFINEVFKITIKESQDMIGMYTQNRLRNVYICNQLRIFELTSKTDDYCTQQLPHIQRMDLHCLPRKMLYYKSQGRRPQGRPKK